LKNLPENANSQFTRIGVLFRVYFQISLSIQLIFMHHKVIVLCTGKHKFTRKIGDKMSKYTKRQYYEDTIIELRSKAEEIRSQIEEYEALLSSNSPELDESHGFDWSAL